MRILVVGDPHGKLPKSLPKKNIDLILVTGDLGKADLAREIFIKNLNRKKEGLKEIEYTPSLTKKVWVKIHNSTLNVLKKLTKIAPTYSLLGNVGASTDYELKQESIKFGVKLPLIRKSMNSIKNFYLVRNRIRRINGLKIGFLDYFLDVSWAKEFEPKDSSLLKRARKKADKAKKILRNFGDVDILVCHQPPYGVLDKVGPPAPKHWHGKHAGSKVILDYIKRKQPKYVFCGHIHEAKGKKKIGKTTVVNVGVHGDYYVLEI